MFLQKTHRVTRNQAFCNQKQLDSNQIIRVYFVLVTQLNLCFVISKVSMAAPRIPYTKTDPARVTYLPNKDIYKRSVGIAIRDGSTEPKNFYLGSDEMAARDRAARLSELWASVVEGGGSEWDSTAMAIAEAIRTGETEFVVPRSARNNDQTYEEIIKLYADRYRGIRFVANSPDLANKVKDQKLRQARWLQGAAQMTAAEFGVSSETIAASGHTLYETLDAYAKHVRATYINVEDHTTTPHGENLADTTIHLKEAYPDTTLDKFDLAAIEAIVSF